MKKLQNVTKPSRKQQNCNEITGEKKRKKKKSKVDDIRLFVCGDVDFIYWQKRVVTDTFPPSPSHQPP